MHTCAESTCIVLLNAGSGAVECFDTEQEQLSLMHECLLMFIFRIKTTESTVCKKVSFKCIFKNKMKAFNYAKH